jgi:dienelactone hydrolase
MAQKMLNITPDFSIPDSKSSWIEKRVETKSTIENLLSKSTLSLEIPEVQILSRQRRENYFLEKFEFQNSENRMVSGYFLIPDDGKDQHPAIFYSHWHGGNYELGKEEIFGTHHTPNIPAKAFIDKGYAVMAIDAYCFGERSGKGPNGQQETGSKEELSESKYQLWHGRSLWEMMLYDDHLALNYLFSRSEIDVNRVGATGISMGATHTWWIMALDERIKTGVAVACMTRYQELINEQKIAAHGIYYFVPGMLKYFDTEAIISLIAPRPILFMTGDQDIGSPVSGIHKIEEKVNKVYHLYKAGENFKNIIYPGIGHEYTKEMWANMLNWFDEKL